MKKFISAISIAIIGVLCFGCLVACGEAEEAVEGTYKFYCVEYGGKQYKTSDEIEDESIKSDIIGVFISYQELNITLKEDGTSVYTYNNGNEYSGTWVKSEDGKKIIIDGNENNGYVIDGDKLYVVAGNYDGVEVILYFQKVN